MEAWFETSGGNIVVCESVGAEEFFLHTILYGNRSDEVGVIDIDDDKICVLAIQCDGESSGLVGEDFSCGVDQVHVDKIGEVIVDGNRGNIIVVVLSMMDMDGLLREVVCWP